MLVGARAAASLLGLTMHVPARRCMVWNRTINLRIQVREAEVRLNSALAAQQLTCKSEFARLESAVFKAEEAACTHADRLSEKLSREAAAELRSEMDRVC